MRAVISEIITRLQAAGTTFRLVAGAAEFPGDENEIKQLDCAFVIPLRERPGPNSLGAGAVHQNVKTPFAVVIFASRSGQTSGKAVDVLKRHKRWVIDQLLAWSPTDCEPIEMGPGALMKLGARTIAWQMEFTTAYDERKV